jgi:hypothetical protein
MIGVMVAHLQPAQPGSLVVGDVRAVRLRASRSPQLSVIMAASTPSDAWTADVAPVRASARRAWSALSMKAPNRFPDSIAPLDSLDCAVSIETKRLRELPGDDIADEIGRLWAGAPPGPWQYAADHPQAWLHSLADACLDAWTALSRRWDLSGAVLDREVARIGVAAVTATTDVLLNSLHPHLRYRDGAVAWSYGCGEPIPLAGRQLVLVPLLNDRRLCLNFDQPGYALIAYPALGHRTSAGGRTSREDDALSLILGPARARALRALDVPRSMQQLAACVPCGASNATYHCGQLEAAGLIARERRGSSVWAARTARGDELIELLDPSRKKSWI